MRIYKTVFAQEETPTPKMYILSLHIRLYTQNLKSSSPVYTVITLDLARSRPNTSTPFTFFLSGSLDIVYIYFYLIFWDALSTID